MSDHSAPTAEAPETVTLPPAHASDAIMMMNSIDDRRASTYAVTVQNGSVHAVEKGDPKSVELQEVKLTDKGSDKDADKEKPVHLMASADVAVKFGTSIDLTHPKQSKGLTTAEATERLKKYGLNQLSPPKELPEIVKYLMYFLDPFMILLLGAGTLSCIAWALDKSQPINLTIGIVLFIITLLSCTFSYFQEGKSADVMKSFKSMLPRNCHCIRDGKEKILPAKELVPGDVIRVATGDQIPADIRIFWTQECKVETSSLTGESVPITMATSTEEARLEEAHDVAFNTSQCLEGEMLGVVFATGDGTVIGRIAALASGTDQSDSPLQKEIKYFVRRLTIFAFCLGCIFFTIGAARNPDNIIIAFINGFIVVMIACVPEGLPMTVTSALTITAKRMAMKNVFIKQLRSVETLGSATVIASDKTGTLTQNKMSVSRVWFDFNPMSVEVAMRDMPYSLLKKNASASTLYNLELVACLCNRSHFEDERDLNEQEAQMMEMSMAISQLDPSMTLHSAKRAYPLFLDRIDSSMSVDSAREKFRITQDDSQRKVLGEPSDMALFNFVKARQSVELMRYHWRKVFEVPFNSRNKYSIVIVKPHLVPNQTRRLLLMKGAPEVILTRCNRWMRYGKAQPIDADFKAHFQQTYEMFGGYGERVLGCAMMELDEKEFPPEMDTKYNLEAGNYPQTDLVFLGLVSLVDPPKASVPPAIEQCRHAGIRVIMVTGDHPLTAAAIARQVGIFTGPTKDQLAKLREVPESEIQEEDVDAIVIKGTDIPNFTEADWHRVLGKKEIVFARTTPAQKLQIVEHLQARGEIVASTGDGVNDSPALKKADIGVAMGISGSDVARDAGDVILMDDDFASLVLGIKEGRTIFDNLGKTVSYTITHMVPEIVPVLINLAFGVPLGLSSLLILSIDLGTELAPSISLAYEKSEGDVMDRPPRNARTDRLVSLNVVGYFMLTGAIYCLVCYLAFFLVFEHHGISASELVFADKYFVADADPFTSGSRTFSESEQTTILAEAQAAYWVMLITAQIAHIFLCKTRAASIFVHGIFNNVTMDYGVVIEIAIVLIIVFTPWANAVFGTSTFPGKIWGMIVFLPGLLFLTSECRKYLYRKYHKSKSWARYLVI